MIKYYARCEMSDKSIIATYKQDSAIPVESNTANHFTFEITQAEYESIVSQATIDAAYIVAVTYLKDINNISKLEKCGFLVIMDYLRSLGLAKTNGQFKNDVITKYEAS